MPFRRRGRAREACAVRELAQAAQEAEREQQSQSVARGNLQKAKTAQAESEALVKKTLESAR